MKTRKSPMRYTRAMAESAAMFRDQQLVGMLNNRGSILHNASRRIAKREILRRYGRIVVVSHVRVKSAMYAQLLEALGGDWSQAPIAFREVIGILGSMGRPALLDTPTTTED